jgi:hypothetical protein
MMSHLREVIYALHAVALRIQHVEAVVVDAPRSEAGAIGNDKTIQLG